MKKLIILVITLFAFTFYSTQSSASSSYNVNVFLTTPIHNIYKPGRTGDINSGTSGYIVNYDHIGVRIIDNDVEVKTFTVAVHILNLRGETDYIYYLETFEVDGSEWLWIPLEDGMFEEKDLLFYEVMVYSNPTEQYVPPGTPFGLGSTLEMRTRGTITNTEPLQTEHDFFYHDLSDSFGTSGDPYEYEPQITFGYTHMNPGYSTHNHLHYTGETFETRYETHDNLTDMSQFTGNYFGNDDAFVMMYYTSSFNGDPNTFSELLNYLDDKYIRFIRHDGTIHAEVSLKALFYMNYANRDFTESFNAVNSIWYKQLAMPLKLNCSLSYNLTRNNAITARNNHILPDDSEDRADVLELRQLCFPPGTYFAELVGYTDVKARSMLISNNPYETNYTKPTTTFPYDAYRFDVLNPFFDTDIFDELLIHDISYDTSTAIPVYDDTPPQVARIVTGRTNRNYFRALDQAQATLGFLYEYTRTSDDFPNAVAASEYSIREIFTYEMLNPSYAWITPTDPGTADADTAFMRFLESLNWDTQAGIIAFSLIPTITVAVVLGMLKIPALFIIVSVLTVLGIFGVMLGFAEWLMIGIVVIAAVGILIVVRGSPDER